MTRTLKSAIVAGTLGALATTAMANVTVTELVTLDGIFLATIDFDPGAGNIYVGTASTETNGDFGAPNFINQVDSLLVIDTLGEAAIQDPDALIFDPIGAISGQAGSVIVGGTGGIFAIAPDNTVSQLIPRQVGETELFRNPTDFAFDSTGRLLFTDYNNNRVMALNPDFTLDVVADGIAGETLNVAVDAMDNVYVTDETGAISIFDAAGTLINMIDDGGDYSGIAIGDGSGFFGDNLVAFDKSTGEMVMFDDTLTKTVLMDGFITEGVNFYDAVFSDSNTLLLSPNGTSTIFQIVPAPTSLALLGLGGLIAARRRR